MERLTVKRQDGRWALANNDGVSNLEQLEKVPRAIDRLAAYEDTGLEPEEVRAQKGLFDYIAPDCDLSDGVRRFQHFRELVQAEKDGRLVVLPCKVGDWVYCLWDVPTDYKYVIYCAEVKEIRTSMRNCRLTTTYFMEPIAYRGHRKEYRDDDIGKTVFLTREEAEAALEKEAL